MLRRWSPQNPSDESPSPTLDYDAGQTSDKAQLQQRHQATMLHRVGQRSPRASAAADKSPRMSTPKRSDNNRQAADRRPAPARIRVSPPKRPPVPAAAFGKSESVSDNDYKGELHRYASGYMQTQWAGTVFDEDSTSATTQFVDRRRLRRKLHNVVSKRKPETAKAADKALAGTTTTLSGDREPYAANFDRTQDELDRDNTANSAAPPMRCSVYRMALRLTLVALSAAATACAFAQHAAYGSLCAGANAAAVFVASVALLVMETLCTVWRRRSLSTATVRRASLPIDSCCAMLLLTTAVLCATMPQLRQSHGTAQTMCIVALSASAAGAVAAALLAALGSMRAA